MFLFVCWRISLAINIIKKQNKRKKKKKRNQNAFDACCGVFQEFDAMLVFD